MISDENIRRAIENVNHSHHWYKNHKPNQKVLWIECTIEDRIKELRQIIENGFEPTEPITIHRYDRNAKKWRNISEPRLWPDQYIHHILIQVLEPIMMRGMDPYCCGSVKGRGAFYGIKAIKRWMKKDVRGTQWCAELDIYHFYEQIQPRIVMDRLKQLIKDYRVLDLTERVMKYGVTIGSYFSQWFANTILQPLDRLIRQSDISHYIRYMDNFTIFSADKESLKNIIDQINNWLNKYGLCLKDNYQYFNTNLRLPNALGYRYGHSFTLIRKHRLLTLKRQIKTFFKRNGRITPKFAMSLLSRLGGLIHCNSTHIYKQFVPNGIQKKLKNVVRIYQRDCLVKWDFYIQQYKLQFFS